LTERVVILLVLLVLIELVLKVCKVVVYGHRFVVRAAFLAPLVPEEIDVWRLILLFYQIRDFVKNAYGSCPR